MIVTLASVEEDGKRDAKSTFNVNNALDKVNVLFFNIFRVEKGSAKMLFDGLSSKQRRTLSRFDLDG